MNIIDLNIENESMVNQTASILFEAFPHIWTNAEEALEEVHECSSNGRISRVAVDDEMNVLGWISGRSMYSGKSGSCIHWWLVHGLRYKE